MNRFDLSIFNDDQLQDIDCDTSNYTKCKAMNRLIIAVKYCSLLNVIENENDREIFRNFVMEMYRQFNDDYIHFQEYHHNELEQIYHDLINNKSLNQCHINECKYTARHHQSRDNILVFDAKIAFYKDMMDTLHFHLFHCFEAGLRILNRTQDNAVNDENNEKQHDDYFDAEFCQIHTKITKRAQNTRAFDRFSNKNTKFNIVTHNEVNQNTMSRTNEKKYVYRDEVFKYFLKLKVSVDGIKSMCHLVETHEYDTDALKDDESLKPKGNIIKMIKSKAVRNIYIGFIKSTKSSPHSFAVGFRFYYWVYYKSLSQLNDNYPSSEKNINEHSGFEVRDLYIEAKYSSLKEEMSHNKHIALNEYNEQVVIKVHEYKQSSKFKQLTATRFGALHHHYDIKKGESIRTEHLLSLVLYTDYTNLCTEFSGTFRRKSVFEPIKSVIRRNMEYYWLSRYLRESVEVFGQCYIDAKRWENDYIRGPFYSGMSVMHIPTFNVRLCSPTSTTKQIAVATKFSGTDGMILQLNNSTLYQYFALHAFNASWISKYKEEDERLFFGGFWFIKIESIRITATKQNFEKFLYSLFYLDAMLTGGKMDALDVSKEDVFIVKRLMKNEAKGFDNYLYETFAAFTSNKTQIVLELFWLNKVKDSGIRDLLFYNMERKHHEEGQKREDNDMTNLFKPQIFEIFNNIQHIIINTNYYFSFSMIGLLLMLESTSVQQIIVKARNVQNKINWIKDIWSLSSNELVKVYKQRSYSIELEQNDRESLFMINKKL